MDNPFIPLLAGIAGTAVMTIFLLVPRWMNVAHVDVIRAVGALITGRQHHAFGPGLLVHLFSGIVFAYIYTVLLLVVRLPINILTGAFLGGVHGAVIMLLVSITIMEHHPIAKYHHRGPMTGLMQLIAHILYGATIGIVSQVFMPAAT